MDKFLQGFACAVAEFIRIHGMDTAVKEVWQAGGFTLAECAEAGMDRYDLDVLTAHQDELS